MIRLPACRCLLYLFHRIEQGLTGDKTLVFLDEGWRALDDPVFEESSAGLAQNHPEERTA